VSETRGTVRDTDAVDRPPRTWETARLLARPPVLDDLRVIFDEHASDPAVARFMTWTRHRSVEETRAFLERCERGWTDGSAHPWSLWHRENGVYVGMVEARVRSTDVEFGYALARRWWRQGLMREALAPLVRWALDQPSIYRAWATCDVENTASARVLERVGMTREGVLRHWTVHPNLGAAPRDCYCYAAVKGELPADA